MKVYVFGNSDLPEDNKAFEIIEKIGYKYGEVQFVVVKPNEDLPFADKEDVIILDVVEGINDVRLMGDSDLDKLVLPPRSSVHDFDLGFQLKYLKKLGKLGKIKIIALPMNKDIDYSSIHSIFKKLVAQDIQGS